MKKPTGKLFKVAVITVIVLSVAVAIPFAVVGLVTRKKK